MISIRIIAGERVSRTVLNRKREINMEQVESIP